MAPHQQRSTSFSPHSITAVMAIVTAVIALGVGMWENVQMREHNRLSVTPHLQLTAEFTNDDERSVDQGIIRLTNEGIGPAVIDRVEVVVTDEEGTERRFANWGEAKTLLEEVANGTLTRRVELGPEVIVGADREQELAIFERPRATEPPLFRALLERLDVRIAYHSVYGESFDTDLRRQRAHAGL